MQQEGGRPLQTRILAEPDAEKVWFAWFAQNSPLEGDGFELPVPAEFFWFPRRHPNSPPQYKPARRLSTPADSGWRNSPIPFLPLTELLPVVDVLSLHLPLTPETTGMIDAAAFAAMKRGGVLINTARGPLVDGAALFEALNREHPVHRFSGTRRTLTGNGPVAWLLTR